MSNRRSPQSEMVAWIGIVSDVALAIAKGGIGYVSGSKALMGDALYSGADAAAKLTEVLPWRYGHSPKDRGAKESKRKWDSKEPVLAIIFSVLILMGGLQIAFSAIRDLTKGHLISPEPSALVVVLISIMLKEAVFQYQYRHFKKQGDASHAAYADNHRYSLYTSLIVLIGVGLSVTGGSLNWHALLYMDPIAGLLTACLVLRKAYFLIARSIYGKELEELPHADATNFIETVQRVHGVIRVEHLKALEKGRYVNLQVKISVNPRITVMEAHDISECAKKLLLHRFVYIGDVHMDVIPYDPGYPYKSNHELADNDDVPTLLQ